MLAVVYEAFTRIEKDKFRKLLLHRRKACQHAFRLLVTRINPTKISFRHFEGLMLYYKPRASRLDTYLMFKALDANKSGYVTLNEFYKVYEVSELKWQRKNLEIEWFNGIKSQFIKTICRLIHKLVEHKWFQILVYVIIGASAVYQVIEAILRSSMSYKNAMKLIQSSPLSSIFVSLYGIEATLKLIGFGLRRYFNSGWNRFDFLITIFAIIGLIFEGFHLPFSFVFVLRSLRLLKLLQYKARYRDIMGAFIFIIVKRFGSVSIVVLVVYYYFAILGMELFASYDLTNCCKNTSLEQYFAFSPNSTLNGYYYLNNFTNIVVSYGKY
jgi:two pore calcium channel protein 1